MQRNRLDLYLQKLIGLLFIIIFVCIATCAVHKYNLYENNELLKISFSCAILLVCSLGIISKLLSLEKWIYNATSIFVISLSIHLFVVLFIGQSIEQVSDFALALETSNRSFPLKEPLVHYQIFSNWAIYPLYLKFIHFIFGSSTFTALIINAVIYALSSSFIYILCHLCQVKDYVGYMAALLYSFWPSHSLYAVILTPEFPNILLTLVSLTFIKTAINRQNFKSCYIFAGFSAIILSLSGFFKSIDKIVLIDIFIVLILYSISKISNCKVNKDFLRLKIFKIFTIFLMIYIITNKLIYIGLDYAYGTAVNRNPSMHFIYIGLNSQTSGTWNEEVGGVYINNVMNYNYDFHKASDVTRSTLLNEIKEKKYLTPTYFGHKFEIGWADNSEIGWTDSSLTDNHPLIKKGSWLNTSYIFTQSFWMLLCLLVCIDSIYIFIKPDYHRSFLCMLILGFTILMLLIEVQARYKCVLYPYISILASDGLHQIMLTIKNSFYRVSTIKEKH